MRTARFLTGCLLLLALIQLATMPDGMMRQAGPAGIRLVLCSDDGLREVWLGEDGEITPVGEADASDGAPPHRRRPHCVQVALSLPEAAPPIPSLRRDRLAFATLARRPHQIAARPPGGTARHPRAPPHIRA